MFHNIPQAMAERMAFLEAVDQPDREDGTPKMQRLRQVPRETGRSSWRSWRLRPHRA